MFYEIKNPTNENCFVSWPIKGHYYGQYVVSFSIIFIIKLDLEKSNTFTDTFFIPLNPSCTVVRPVYFMNGFMV